MKRRTRIACALTAAVVWLCLTATPSLSHALLRSSSPGADSVLDEPPERVILAFSEAPEVALSQVRVLDGSGADLAAGPLRPEPGDPARVGVGLRTPLPEGVYAVSWRVYSSVDGHVTAGVFAFGVGTEVEGAAIPDVEASSEPGPSPLELSGRWLLLSGLGLLLGVAFVGAYVFGIRRPGLVALATAGWSASLAGVLLLGAAQWTLSGAAPAIFVSTPIGRAVLLRAACVSVAGAGLLVAARSRAWRAGLGVSMLGAFAAVVVHASAGHAAAGPNVVMSIASQSVHFSAGAVWLGGLAALLSGIRSMDGPDRGRAVRRFSTAALVCVALVVASGTTRALVEVGSWAALIGTWYGRLVVGKIVLLGLLVAIGARQRIREVPRVESSAGGLMRFGRVEMALAVAVVAATGMLTSLTPPRGEVLAAAPEPLTVEGSDFATTVRVSLTVDPGTPGLNSFEAQVSDHDTGEPVEAERVALRFSPPPGAEVAESTLDLRRTEAGRWTGRGPNLAADGTWTVVVVVQQPDSSVEVPLEVATRCRSRRTVTPGQPTLHDVDIGGGRTVQGYADPGRIGPNDIHFTFFSETGDEMSVTGVVGIGASREGGSRMRTEVRQFSPGHFVGSAELPAEGSWRFDVTAQTPQGERLTACFEEVL